MKKIILGTIAIGLCTTLTACGTANANATITDLSNSLDDTANTISGIQTLAPSDLSISQNFLKKINAKENDLTEQSRYAQNFFLNENNYKSFVLKKTSIIKNNLSNNIKLTKAQSSALKELTSCLNKYTNFLEHSESEMKNSIKSATNMKKNIEKNNERLDAKLNKIICDSNIRISYLQNILTTLNKIDSYLPDSQNIANIDYDCEDCNNNSNLRKKDNNLINEKIPEHKTNNNKTKKNHNLPTPNIDTYGPARRNIDSFGFENYNNGLYSYEFGYGYNMPYNRQNTIPYRNNYQMYNWGLNQRNNPYYPYNAYNSNNYNRYTNQEPFKLANSNIPEQRLEDYEKRNKDNTIEKIEKDEFEKIKTENCESNKYKTEKEIDKPIEKFNSKDNTKNKTEISKFNNDKDDLNEIIIAH